MTQSKNSISYEEQLLKEYDFLTERSIDTSKGTRQFFVTSITINAAAIAYSFEQKEPLIVLAGIIYMIFSLIYVKGRDHFMTDITNYIKENIEPNFDGLNWFMKQNKRFEEHRKKKKWDWRFRGYLIFMGLSLAVYGIESYAFCNDLLDNIMAFPLWIILFLLTLGAIIVVTLIIRKKDKKYEQT